MDKKISELDQVLQINNDAVIPISQNSGGIPTTYKAQITQIGAEIGEDQTFSNLQTTDKTLVGAINEVSQGGGGGGSSNANIAPDYDATSTYAVGDWCIYNGTLYQCNTAISVAEAFDPTHWTAKKVVDAFADIEDELDDKVDTADYTAELLPIQSGSATNTKDYIDDKFTYSTSEKAIGTWIDGRTVYQKVILINDTISNSWVDADTISGITRIVGAEFIVYEGGARGGGVRQGLFAEISLIDTDVVKIYNNTGYNIQVDYLILKYIKS